MTIGEQYEQRKRETRKECSTCSSFPSCYMKNPADFAFDGCCDSWKAPEVPHYIRDIKV